MLSLTEDKWTKIRNVLKSEFSSDAYNDWISKLNLISITSNAIVFSVETLFIKEWISREFLDAKKKKINGEYVLYKKGIKQILKENFSIDSVELIVDKTKKTPASTVIENNVESISQNGNLHNIGINLNSSYTFDNFVVGESNKLAYSVAKSIANGDKFNYQINPFFIYGKVGLGKTHLLQAIAWELKNKDKTKNIVYLSAERFMNLSLQALNAKSIQDFKESFKTINTLLIDDLQFIAGKEWTQKEFVYVLNTFLNAGKTICMVCDEAPKNMKSLDDKLKSKISAGIVVDITEPDYNLRLELAKKKAEMFGLTCDHEVFEYIAKDSNATNRDVEGAIKKLLINQQFMKQEIDLKLITKILEQKTKTLNIELIQRKVAEYFKITTDELLSDKRNAKYSFPRQIAFYLARKLTKKSYPDIGKAFGKTHATVLFAHNKIEAELKTKNDLNEIILAIENTIK